MSVCAPAGVEMGSDGVTTTMMFGNRTWLKGKRSEDASWPENAYFFFFLNVPVFPSTGFAWLFYRYLYKRSSTLFCFDFQLPRAQPCWCASSLPMKRRKGCLSRDVLILWLPHILKWHGAWLYGVHRTRRDGSSFMWHQPCQRCKYAISVNIEKRAIKSYSFM